MIFSNNTKSLKSYYRTSEVGNEIDGRFNSLFKARINWESYLALLKGLFGNFMFWFYILSGFIVARGTIFDGLAPFGIALLLALIKGRSKFLFAGIIGVLAGEFYRTGPPGVLTIITMMVFVFTIDHLKAKIGFKDFSWWLFAGLMYAGIKFIPMSLRGVETYEFYQVIFETGLVVVTGIIFIQAICQLEEKKWPKGYIVEEIIPLAFLLIAIIAGFQGVELLNFNVQYIIASLVVLMIAYTVGGGIGAAAGTILGTVLIFSYPSPATIGALTLGGLLGGVFNDFKKPGSLVGFLIGAGLMVFYLSRPFEIIDSLEEIGIAALVFLIVPGSAFSYVRKMFPMNGDKLVDESMADKKDLSKALSRRVEELSSLFKELSCTFDDNDEEAKENKEEIEIFMEKVAENVCFDCVRYNHCWEENFFVTYRGIVETLSNFENKTDVSRIEDKDLSNHLLKHCMRPLGLKEDLKAVYEVFKIDVGWKRRLNNHQEFVSQQLQGISEIMENISRELEKEMKNEEELESDIINVLSEQNIPIKSIKVHKTSSSGKAIIEVELKKCKRNDLCDKVINYHVSNLLGEKLMVTRSSCFHRKEDNSCIFKLRPFKAYNLVTGVSQLTGERETTSGDSYLSRQLRSGQQLLLLSDGMGKGKNARGESNTTVNLLEKLLNSGFERDFVIKNVNAILNLKSQDETFATMDLAFVDMLNGKGEFYKAGAMPSYILREESLEKIEGESLPAGILNSMEPAVKKFALTANDTLIMLSDGVFSPGEKEDWLENELLNFKDSHPQVIADELLKKVERRFYGEIKDDVTIMVSKLKKNFKTRG